jgi:hypothetical protein
MEIEDGARALSESRPINRSLLCLFALTSLYLLLVYFNHYFALNSALEKRPFQGRTFFTLCFYLYLFPLDPALTSHFLFLFQFFHARFTVLS